MWTTVSHALWMPISNSASAAPPMTNNATSGFLCSRTAVPASVAETPHGTAAYQSQSCHTGWYSV